MLQGCGVEGEKEDTIEFGIEKNLAKLQKKYDFIVNNLAMDTEYPKKPRDGNDPGLGAEELKERIELEKEVIILLAQAMHYLKVSYRANGGNHQKIEGDGYLIERNAYGELSLRASDIMQGIDSRFPLDEYSHTKGRSKKIELEPEMQMGLRQ